MVYNIFGALRELLSKDSYLNYDFLTAYICFNIYRSNEGTSIEVLCLD